jgi:inosine triphosphate pyrophosphatase
VRLCYTPIMPAAAQVPVRALYVTGNAGKFEEASHIAQQLCGDALKLERVEVDLPEPQGSAEEISISKSLEAAKQLQESLKTEERCGVRFIVTDDGGLELSCMNGFPGVYIKPMLEKLQDLGIGDLVHRYDDHAAQATCTLGVIDLHEVEAQEPDGKKRRPNDDAVGSGRQHSVQTFHGSMRGSIIREPRGNVKHGKKSWNTVFVPEGYAPRTFGEMPMVEHAHCSHRRRAFEAWVAAFPVLSTGVQKA